MGSDVRDLSSHTAWLSRGVRTPRIAAAALLVVALGAAMLLSGAAQASATVLEPLSIEQMSARSIRVVVGIVAAVREDAGTPDTGPRTGIDITVSDTLKGASSSTLTAYVPGGTAPGGLRMSVDGMPTFAVGEPCAVFVDANGWIMGGFQGKVIVRGGRVPGEGESVAGFSARVRGASKGGAIGLPVAPQQQAPPLSPSGEPLVTSAAGPAVTSISPNTASAGTGTSIAISGRGFGASQGTGSVSFYYQGGTRIPASIITQWTDGQIVCEVPVAAISDYFASAGSGDVLVTTSAGLTSTAAASGSANLTVAFGYGGQKWAVNSTAAPHTRVTFRVNRGGTPNVQAMVQAAAAAWSNTGADFTFVDGGLTSNSQIETRPDYSNDLMWGSGLPAGTIAQAQTWSTSNGSLVDCDVLFSTAYSWGDGSPGTMDVQSIATHEMGHWLFLRDLYGSADLSKVMYGYGFAGTVRRTLSSGDIAGIRWVYGGQTAVFRFYNLKSGTHFYTADLAERDNVIATLGKTYHYEGLAYTIDTSIPANKVPLYRFYNMRTGTHFYTASEAEKLNVVATMSSTYHLDGVAYTVSSYNTSATPVYRFYNVRSGTHFYTADEGEKNRVIADLGAIYRLEGPAFYISH